MTTTRRLLLRNLVEIEVGYAFKSSGFSTDPDDVRLLRGDNVASGCTRWDRPVFWPRNAPVDPRYELRSGDVVLAMDRPWIDAGLKYARIRDQDLPALLVQRVARLRARPGTDQRYVEHVIASQAFTEHVLAIQTGSAIPHISGGQIGDFSIRPHALDEQRAIADVLGALDDKIAANAGMIETATALSAALFSSMGATEPRPLTSVAEFVNGRAFTKDASGTGRVVVRIAELNSGIGGSTVFSDAEVPDQHVARPGDILFAWSGSLTLHRWFRPEAIVNQHIFKVIPRAGYPHWLVWGLLTNRLDEFKAIAADKATTMGHIQRRHLEEPVAVPVPALVAQHNDAMTALWSHALAAEVENLTLAAARDALLPALMSGRLRVRDAASGIPQSPR